MSRIAGFCTNSNKKFSGEDPQTPPPPFKEDCLRLYYNHNPANHLKVKKKQNKSPPPPPRPLFCQTQNHMVSVCLIWKVHCWSFFRKWMFERTKKSPWKLLENVPQKSLKSPWKRYVLICGNHVYAWQMSMFDLDALEEFFLNHHTKVYFLFSMKWSAGIFYT